ncbi:MAG TPA: ferrous iron transport protein B [Pseudobdellovibrionaceae bacterium]|nr:ferrous iron transport protein B [Pseudobdellovibrionaceae bacterium]
MHSNLVKNDTVLLVGAPNSGKTTLFNSITGSHFKTTNYPGATVEYSEGSPKKEFHQRFSIIDSPGIYSLSPKTEDEVVTYNLLFLETQTNKPITIVVVVDATHFSRQALIAQQLKESGFNVIIALTMADILKESSIQLNLPYLEKTLGLSILALDSRNQEDIKKLLNLIQQTIENPSHKKQTLLNPTKKNWTHEEMQHQFKFFEDLEKQSFISQNTEKSLSQIFGETAKKIDQWLLHPFWGLFFFITIMTLLFASVFWFAAPFMDFIDSGFSNSIEFLQSRFEESLGLNFVLNGLVAGIGAFIVFVPQIAILFFGLGLLEDSGYLARAATLIDKPLSKIGLNGRSFVPILSSFACAVPGMMAARTIPNKKEKFLTLFILPLMTCSARLPVYALMISFLLTKDSFWGAGLLMAFLYFSSLLLGGIVASVVNRFLPKTSNSFFLLELPSYRKPLLKKVFKNAYDRTSSFIFRAGPIILGLSLVIWFSSNFPNYKIKDATARFETSYAAQLGQYIEPLFKPMGADWRVGLGIISSFAAREVFVSTLATLFNVTETEDETNASLLEKMRNSRFQNADGSTGELIFTLPSVVALLVFFMIALQCMATVGIAKSEFGGWKMALIQLASYNVLAYVLSVITYQTLKIFL